MNWPSLLGERGLCRRGACPIQSELPKGCVSLGLSRTLAASQNHPSRSCIDPRGRRPLSTTGHLRTGIHCTIRPGLQSIPPTRAFSHRSCPSGDHHDDPTIHIRHNTIRFPHHWNRRPSRGPLLLRTNTRRRRPTRGPSHHPRASPANSARRVILL